jgi:hypothetical protein
MQANCAKPDMKATGYPKGKVTIGELMRKAKGPKPPKQVGG